MNINANKSNVSGIALHIEAIRRADADKELAIGFLSQSIVESWSKPLIAVIGKGEDAPRFSFSVSTMHDRHWFANGKEVPGTTFVNACYASLAEEFGVPGGFDMKDKQAFKRARRIAGAFVVLDVPVEWSDEGVSLPAGVIFDLTEVKQETVKAEDGSDLIVEVETPTKLGKQLAERVKGNAKLFGNVLTDEQAMDAAKALPLVANGKVHPILDERIPAASTLAAKFAEPLTVAGFDNWEPRKAKDASDAERTTDVAMNTSIEFIAKCIDTVLAGDESDLTPSLELEQKLGDLHDKIGAFIANLQPEALFS